MNYENLPDALFTIVSSPFLPGDSVAGGFVGALVVGVQRAAFASEAGIGSSSIEHSTAKTSEHIREGCLALLEPFIGICVICLLTGLVIVVTNQHMNINEVNGILMTAEAFNTVSPWFFIFLYIAAPLFAFSTVMTNCYHGERAWAHITNGSMIGVYRILFCIAVFSGSIFGNFSTLLKFVDTAFLLATIPNLIALYLLVGQLDEDTRIYIKKYLRGGSKN